MFCRKYFTRCYFGCSFDQEITEKIKMNTQNNHSNKFLTENRSRLVLFVLLFLLSSIGMFGQTRIDSLQTKATTELIVLKETTVASVESQIDFVSWFMGTKQSQMMDSKGNQNSSKVVTKKQILFLGITPNKVLYRTFMKKVSSQNSAIV